jgi:hypothetical protein
MSPNAAITLRALAFIRRNAASSLGFANPCADENLAFNRGKITRSRVLVESASVNTNNDPGFAQERVVLFEIFNVFVL